LPEARYVGVEVYDQTGALRASTLQETGS
jgi:hypothetical protein